MRQLCVLLIIAVAFLAVPLTFNVAPMPVQAQGTAFCDRSSSISSNSGTTTIGSARGVEIVFICGYRFTGTTAGTTLQFASSGTNLTGTMTVPQWGSVGDYSGGAPLLYGVAGATVTAACGTGQCFGWVNWGQR